MSFLANLVGSGLGIIVIAVVMIALGYVGHAPGATHPWIHRFFIVVMYGAGSLLALTGAGALWLSIASHIADLAGGLGGGPAHVVIVIASVILILGLVIGLWKAPNAQVVTMAAIIPFVLMLTSYGFVHSFWVSTSAPAQQLAAQFGQWLGG